MPDEQTENQTARGASGGRRGALALGAAAAALGAVALRFAGIDWARLNRFERTVGVAGLRSWQQTSPFGATLDAVLTVAVPLGLIALAVVLLRVYGRGERRLAVSGAMLVAGSFVTTELLKLVLAGRLDMPHRLANGYPSGHTTLAFATGVAVVLVAPWRGRITPTAAAAGYTALIGGGVVSDGWHLPTDALGALCVTAAWALGVLALVDPPRRAQLGRRDLVGAVALASVATLLLLSHAGLRAHAPLVRQAADAVVAVAAAATVATLSVGYAIAARSASTTRS